MLHLWRRLVPRFRTAPSPPPRRKSPMPQSEAAPGLQLDRISPVPLGWRALRPPGSKAALHPAVGAKERTAASRLPSAGTGLDHRRLGPHSSRSTRARGWGWRKTTPYRCGPRISQSPPLLPASTGDLGRDGGAPRAAAHAAIPQFSGSRCRSEARGAAAWVATTCQPRSGRHACS